MVALTAKSAQNSPKRAAGISNCGMVWFSSLSAIRICDFVEENGAGDEARTRNFQLGNLNFRSFIFNTYKIAQNKCTCMHCIPCIECLICVSLGDVWGTVCYQTGPYVIMLGGDPRALGRDVRGRTDQVPHHLPADRKVRVKQSLYDRPL